MMTINLAQRRVNEFQQRCGDYGETALHLAYHAALPVALNAELLHLLRINFFLDPPETLPYTAEFELLLSPLCREIDEGLYEIEPEIRDVLLAGLTQFYDTQRIRDLATLLWQYVEHHSPWSDRVELERAQQLTALNFLDSGKAQQWLATVEPNASQSEMAEREWFVAMRQEIENQSQFHQEAVWDKLQRLTQIIAEANTDNFWELATLAKLDPLKDFAGADLTGVDLTGASLHGANLVGTNLSNARLAGSTLSHADLTAANLSGADLSRIVLENAVLINANLTGAHLNHSILRGANCSQAKLREAHLDFADLRHARLDNATLEYASLVQADLSYASLVATNLAHANLEGADLTNVDLSQAIVLNAIFSNNTGLVTNILKQQLPVASLRSLSDSRLWTLQGEVMRIGRGENNDLVLQHPEMSRQHAEISCRHLPEAGTQPTYFLRDFSRWGTWIQIPDSEEWQRVHQQEVEITTGTQLKFGNPNSAVLEFSVTPVVPLGQVESSREKLERESAVAGTILWVDDHPDNNIFERQRMEALGIQFVLATTTEKALEQLKQQQFDLIISDMGRPPDLRAGYTLLGKLRSRRNQTPVIIYATSNEPQHVAEAQRRGAIGCTNNPTELSQMVLSVLGQAKSSREVRQDEVRHGESSIPEEANSEEATDLNELAKLYASQGRYSEAEPLLLQALQIRQQQLGPEHPDTAMSLNNLAGLYRSQGRYSEAESLYEQALALYRQILGENHPSVVQVFNKLAGLHRQIAVQAQPEANNLSPDQRRRLEKEEARLQERDILLNRHLQNLRRDYATETNAAKRLKLQKQIEEVDLELLQLQADLETISHQLVIE
jgi:uncharacterized protein YjbI with pentapeptide repeats/DNA-binding NarL/FixJ family response regulator